MSAQVAPTIPPRPTRASQQAATQGVSKLPDIPPRPLPKRLDRSVSPANYPRSPLNEPWGANTNRRRSNEQANVEALRRPPSVQNLPSLGQEGMEYADILATQTNQEPPASALGADAAAQTRNIGHDLHLHAPKPSLPKSSATAQVQAVTRTDSQQAAYHGLGKPPTPAQEEGESLHTVRTRNSFSRPSSTVEGGRRSSVYGGEETGPAEIGLRVPINPLLGDVQAPSPAPHSPHNTGGNGEKRRPHHSRTKSGREIFAPPGSYGLHGHGLPPQDKFEKDWYAKHPDIAQHEETHGHGVYESIGSGRGSFALSSDDLNKIVRSTASRGTGMGTSGTTFSYPDEQIGYKASEFYTSRSQQNTPNSLAKTITNTSQPAAESPLRKASFPADETIPAEVRRGRLSISGKSDDAVESEAEQEVHVEPRRRYNKITGGEESLNETQEARPYASHPTLDGDYINEHGYTVPILAEDEVAKAVGIEHLQPAISPKAERHDGYRSGDATPGSRPSSRPTSLYGLSGASTSLQRFISHHDDRDAQHTPLEDVEEYEPLFPDDDGKKSISHAERFKQRPHVLKQRFPSQDIWEDTPSSAMYSAEVSTPDLPAQAASQEASKTFETPEQEGARKGEPSEAEREKLIPNEERLAKSRFAPHLRDDMPTRPGQLPRFPSSDIWEDSPDSHHLVTTVSNPPMDDEPESPADTVSKPAVPPRPGRSRLGEEASSSQVAPSIPARPLNQDASATKATSPTELKKVPSIPDRPKPQIPVRPAKKTPEASGSAEQEKVSPAISKVKPQVPARPGAGSKIANLRGNFMNDLNAKLGLGPPKEKEKEPEQSIEEAKPLEDARKGRARGPQRRAPAKSPASSGPPTIQFSMFKPHSLWTIDDTDEVSIISQPAKKIDAPSPTGATPSSITLSSEKAEQIENSTVADTPLPSTIDTTDHALAAQEQTEEPPPPQDQRKEFATEIAKNTAGDLAEPTLGTPTQERPNPLSHHVSDEDDGLSKETTASSDQASGPTLEREDPDPSTDAIPVSKQTTASTDAGTVPLEHALTHESSEAPKEPRAEALSEGEPGKASAEQV
ncbi:uncharacterized protein A1O9_02929 [Exophiala aquamarina CBS 119918]|uniref:Altered inheritance of mitochondria protein 21 n=1 Tax=Exophiala aquamarina CBS 119918 TaxID=1182545 RepID=A0A072PPV9_9EURO|nr:uncharacterized protein A1O9_02929 [Exophiala aquamarina CBS 119918]KEF61363.1 hypothetical protein A1O9_02929 [Exophiala aquamarina CBS 119918]